MLEDRKLANLFLGRDGGCCGVVRWLQRDRGTDDEPRNHALTDVDDLRRGMHRRLVEMNLGRTINTFGPRVRTITGVQHPAVRPVYVQGAWSRLGKRSFS